MSSVVISGDTSGAITLAAPSVAGTNTATLPAATGTVMVSGNMPAFSYYQNTQQTGISNVTSTKVNFDTKEFDTNNNFSSNRFTPTVAGYYQVNCCTGVATTSTSNGLAISIYKNGSQYKDGNWSNGNAAGYPYSTASTILYMNGSTDYIEVYVYGNMGGSFSLINAMQSTFFNGVLVRAA